MLDQANYHLKTIEISLNPHMEDTNLYMHRLYYSHDHHHHFDKRYIPENWTALYCFYILNSEAQTSLNFFLDQLG